MKLTDIQSDALGELGNIGAAHAATTLSQMLMTQIDMDVPKISIIDIAECYRCIGEERAALVAFGIKGEVKGEGFIVLYMPQTSAIRLTNTMLGMTDMDREMNEMDQSAIIEIGNIMVSAFLDGTAELLGIIMLPSPPRTSFNYPKHVFDLVIKESNILYDNVVFFKTELICDEHELSLNIFMLPNPPVLLDIVKMLEKIIEDSAAVI